MVTVSVKILGLIKFHWRETVTEHLWGPADFYYEHFCLHDKHTHACPEIIFLWTCHVSPYKLRCDQALKAQSDRLLTDTRRLTLVHARSGVCMCVQLEQCDAKKSLFTLSHQICWNNCENMTVSPPLFSSLCTLGQMAALGRCVGTCTHTCVHMRVCECLCKWCLIVLCVTNCCDSRNVCVTSTPWSESISCCFWVSLAGYHSNTHTHTMWVST